MKTRLNRSLSSIKSLAPCFIPLRVRHTSAYDFICRRCGEVLQPERAAFSLLDDLANAVKTGAGKTDVDLNGTLSVRDCFAEADELRAARRTTP